MEPAPAGFAQALAAHLDGQARPAYFIALRWDAGRVQQIRDFRYVSYIAGEAAYTPA